MTDKQLNISFSSPASGTPWKGPSINMEKAKNM